MATYDPKIVEDPRFKELSPEQQAQILQALGPLPKTTAQFANEKIVNAHNAVNRGLTAGLEKILPEGWAENIAPVLNPLPASITDVGQLAGSAVSTLMPGGPLMRIGWNVLGSMGGRSAGAAVEGRDMLTEGLIGGATGLVPGAISGGRHAARTLMGRGKEKMVVNKAIDVVSDLIPGEVKPKLSHDIAILQRQLAKTGNASVHQWAKRKFVGEIDAIKGIVGNQSVMMPSLNAKKPVKVADVIDAISESGARITWGESATSGAQKMAQVSREKVINELNDALQRNGLDQVAEAYAMARHDFARTQDVLRLLTQAPKGTGGKPPLDLESGKIDLQKLQLNFLNTRHKGGLRSFGPLDMDTLENTLGRGSPLRGTDQKLNVPFISGTSAGSFRLGGSPNMLDLPRAAGINFQESHPLSQLLLPMMLGTKFSTSRGLE